MGDQGVPACDDINLCPEVIKIVDACPHCVSLLLPWGVLVEGVPRELLRARPGGHRRQEEREVSLNWCQLRDETHVTCQWTLNTSDHIKGQGGKVRKGATQGSGVFTDPGTICSNNHGFKAIQQNH